MARRPRPPLPEVFDDLTALRQAVSAAEKWPPGYRALDDIVQEYGRDHAQNKLMSGQWLAFRVHLKTGELEPIPVTTWCLARGRTWLDEGATRRAEFLPGGKFEVISYTVIVRVSERQPPWTDNSEDENGWAVRRARELMDAAFPQGEWRQMTVKAVQKGCEQEAKTREVKLPSADSFSRAMNRRSKRK
jgi:hypothetical protein